MLIKLTKLNYFFKIIYAQFWLDFHITKKINEYDKRVFLLIICDNNDGVIIFKYSLRYRQNA